MVLTRWVAVAASVLAAVVSQGCLHRPPPVKLESATKVAVAFVADAESGGQAQDVPEAVKEAVARELASRNLQAETVPFEKLQDPFSRVRASERRFAWLEESTDAPLVLLVETKATFYAQISGRYRWVVLARLTGDLRKTDAEATVRTLEEPVMLVFDHQRQPQALTEAAPRIAELAGALFDDLLATPAAPPAGTAPSGVRLPDPGAIYFVMVDRFANGDPSNDGAIDPKDPAAFHGGDLQGVIDHLDALEALGVGTVWLSPIFKMRTEKFFGYGAFHGYWVEDLRQVEPRFGDVALLRKLSDELHRRGMKLVLDLVLNHVGPDTRLVTEKPHWFHRKGALEKWDDPAELETKDVHGLPDLAQDNPEVYRYLVDASKLWIDLVRPDGFRLDAVKHMPASFWAKYTAELRQHAGEDFLLLGEMLDGDPKVLARTMREGGFNAIFDFPLHFAINDVFCKDQSAAKLGAALAADRMYEDATRLVTLVDNHDLPRLASACGNDLRKIRQALLLTLTARGTPSLTWGTESALQGAHEPENRGDMRFDHLPLRDFIARVMALRAAHPSLTAGVPLLVDVGPDRFVYARVSAEELSLVAVNRGPSALDVAAPVEARWSDALTQKGVSALRVPAGEVALFVAKGDFGALSQRAQAEWKGQAEPRRVMFAVAGLPAEAAQGSVRVVGSASELGAWDPHRAPEVPAGQSHLELVLPVGAVSEFKLVTVGKDRKVVWEDGANRVLFVRPGAEPIGLRLRWEERDQARAARPSPAN